MALTALLPASDASFVLVADIFFYFFVCLFRKYIQSRCFKSGGKCVCVFFFFFSPLVVLVFPLSMWLGISIVRDFC